MPSKHTSPCYLNLFGASTASALLAATNAASLATVAVVGRTARNPLATATVVGSPAPVTTSTFLPAPTLGRAAIAASSLALTLEEVSASEAAWVAGGSAHELDVRALNVRMAGAVGGKIAHRLSHNGGVACHGSKSKEDGGESEELHC